MPKVQSRENSLILKMRGAGDAVHKMQQKTPCNNAKIQHERVAVPSARKFTATLAANKDPSVENKLKQALNELEKTPCKKMKKAKSVAEITPTKTKPAIKRLKMESSSKNKDDSAITLHATPRSPPRRLCNNTDDEEERRRQRLGGLIYQRLILFAWRRTKERVKMLSESLQRRHEQMTKLEQQVNCLKSLNQSECEKTHATTMEMQKLESFLELLKQEKEQLLKEKSVSDEEREKLKIKCIKLDESLHKTLNEMEEECLHLKKLENALKLESGKVKHMQEKQIVALGQLQMSEKEIAKREEKIDKLQESLRNAENELTNFKLLHNHTLEELNNLHINYTNEVRKNAEQKNENDAQHRICKKTKQRLDNLEMELLTMTMEYEKVLNENRYLCESLMEHEDKARFIWNSAKHVISMSWTFLQNAAIIMLPAAR